MGSDRKSITISIRIQGKVTSVSLRKNIVALWILMLEIRQKEWKNTLVDFIYGCSESWKNTSAKGFSDFISSKMIESILEDADYHKYNRILRSI